MIKHHPSQPILNGFATGDLPASIAIGVSIHCQMCEQCRQDVSQLTERYANNEFDQLDAEAEAESDQHSNPMQVAEQSRAESMYLDNTYIDNSNMTVESDLGAIDEAMFENMFSAITSDDEISEQPVERASLLTIRGNKYELPKALNNVHMSDWLSLGKLSRSSLNLDEGAIHSHLLFIDKDGEVPAHTHKGYEITLLLEGSFEDDLGEYHPGDFIELDGKTNHQPRTKTGCLCYTVADDALVFTEGFHKLFNPIGNLLY
jgi:putative transcriptional regulator